MVGMMVPFPVHSRFGENLLVASASVFYWNVQKGASSVDEDP
jgi:hypothetical protein